MISNDITAPVRQVTAKVEALSASTESHKATGALRLDNCTLYENITIEVSANTEVRVFGKNLYNPEEFKLSNYYLLQNGVATPSTGYKCVLGYIPITHLQGKTITLNHPVAEKSTSTNARAFVFYTENKEGSAISGANTRNGTYTVPETANYMRFTVPNNYTEADIQIELSDSVTEYEEYKEPTVATADESGKIEFECVNSTHTILATGQIEVSKSITIVNTYTQADRIKAITLDRTGANKFFGFGVCQKANLKLINNDGACVIGAGDKLSFFFNDLEASPQMQVTEVHKDEVTNELSVTAYDALYFATKHTIAELELVAPYTLSDLLNNICHFLGIVFLTSRDNYQWFNLSYAEGANFDGSETLREVLDAVAEITFSVYYIENGGLIFERFSKNRAANYTIDKEQYFTLKNKDNKRLSAICSATDLGDNVIAEATFSGSTQYIRNNPLLELREDITTILDNGLAVMGGLTINQFECEWRGNYNVKPCAKIALVAKDGTEFYSYLVNDTIEYNGSYKQKTYWEFEDSEDEHANSSNLGEVLKQTYAKVDKANKEIEIVASEVEANASNISQLQIDTNGIYGSITSMEKAFNDGMSSINGEVLELTNKVNATMTSEEIKLEIEKEISNGVDKVNTTKGFTFDDQGLAITSSESDISTVITEDGMTVKKGSKEVLIADNEGVTAVDLNAKTFLIIGKYSRFQDYPSKKRTACFWIGG